MHPSATYQTASSPSDQTMLRRAAPPPDRRSGSLIPTSTTPNLSAAATAAANHSTIPRRFSLRSIKRRSKSRVHDASDMNAPSSQNDFDPPADPTDSTSTIPKRASLRSNVRSRASHQTSPLECSLIDEGATNDSASVDQSVSPNPASLTIISSTPTSHPTVSQSQPHSLRRSHHALQHSSSHPHSLPHVPSNQSHSTFQPSTSTIDTPPLMHSVSPNHHNSMHSPPPAENAVPTLPRPRRMMFFREEGVMRVHASRRDRTPSIPPHVDPLALIRNMPALAEGWIYLAVHAAPGIAQGPKAKWMFRRNIFRRYAQVRGNVVLLYSNPNEHVHEIFSPVGCAVSSADTVVNRRGAVEHNVNIAKNGFTLQLKLKSEADADLWAAVLRDISLVRQPHLADFQLIAPIGEGASGKVFLVRDSKTGRKLALKCMSKKGGSFGYSASEFRHAVDERLAHDHMNDANFIVKLRHAFQTRDKLYLATEFCDGGDVYNFVDMRGGGVSEEQARVITAQVLLGLKSLHDECIVFRDLKPENVLLDRDGRVRLADFGLCKMLDSADALTRTVCGTFSYAAAEILEENGYGLSCDLWALGTFLYHIMIGRPPRVAGSLQEARDNIFNSKEPIIWYSDVMSEQAMSLVTALIEVDPDRRLGCGPDGIAEVCAHPFFKDIDWVALTQGQVPPVVTQELPPPEQGDLRNFNQEEWRGIRMDVDQDCPGYTESVLWPLRNLTTHPLPRDYLVSYSYSCESVSSSGARLVIPQGAM